MAKKFGLFVMFLFLMSSLLVFSIPATSTTAAESSPRASTYTLTSGVSKYASVTTTTSGKYDYFKIVVSGTPSSIHAVLDTVSNDDLDVYYKYNAKPSTTSYEASAATSSADETLDVPSNRLVSGTHYFRVQRYSGTGTDYYYFTVTVTTGGGTSDTTAPTVSISNPSSGATVSGTVSITFTATDNVGVTSRSVKIDGTQVATASGYSWNTLGYSNGAHTILVQAYDAAGNVGSDTHTVTVSNTVSDDGGPLTAGVTANGNMDSADGADMWYIDIGANAQSMRVVLECGSADFDTYGKFNAQPTTSSYDWRGYTSGGEDNTVSSPAQGRHYIMVDYYSGSGAYTLLVTVTYGGGTTSAWGTGGKYAIVVGISNYQSISDLSYCDEDAYDWYQYLTGKGYEVHVFYDGSYTSNSFKNLPTSSGAGSSGKVNYATEANVRAAMQGLADHAQSGDSVAFITSGHGSGTGTGSSYLCMYDCSGSAGCYYDTEIASDMSGFASGVKIFVFIDHCYSGGIGPELMNLAIKSYIYCTTTCTANGYGYDDPTHSNGAWTYEFLERYLVGSPNSSMESIYDQASASYPHTGGDACMEFDGNTGSYFYL
jgi:hypothetical protein